MSIKVNMDEVERDVQGNILRGYNYHLVRYPILEVSDRQAARQFLGTAASGGSSDVPAITPDSDWGTKPPACFNIGLTYCGLQALGVSRDSLASFPTEFVEGVNKRASKLGDTGDCAHVHWPAPFDHPEKVHIIASVYAEHDAEIAPIQEQIARVFNILGVRDGSGLGKGKVFFGYKDSISELIFKGVKDPTQASVDEAADPLGTIRLGYPTQLEGLVFRVPLPTSLGHNGSFNAFRVLAQDSAGFETYLDHAAGTLLADPEVDRLLPPGAEKKVGKGLDRHAALREIVAAPMWSLAQWHALRVVA